MRRELLLALGDAQARSGDLSGANESFQQVAAAVQQGDPARRPAWAVEQMACAALGLGAGTKSGMVDQPTIALLEESLAAPGDEDSRRLVINHKHVHVGFDAC